MNTRSAPPGTCETCLLNPRQHIGRRRTFDVALARIRETYDEAAYLFERCAREASTIHVVNNQA